SSALSTRFLIASRELPTGLMTLGTWFLFLPLATDFFPVFFSRFFAIFLSGFPFFVVKVFVAIKFAFRQNAYYSKNLADFGRTFIRYPVAHSYGIRSHIHTVSGRTFIRYYRTFTTKVFHTCTYVYSYTAQ